MWESLRKKVNRKLVEKVQSMYVRNVSCVETREGRTDWFEVKTGLRQGSVLSPMLFNIVLDEENWKQADQRHLEP